MNQKQISLGTKKLFNLGDEYLESLKLRKATQKVPNKLIKINRFEVCGLE